MRHLVIASLLAMASLASCSEGDHKDGRDKFREGAPGSQGMPGSDRTSIDTAEANQDTVSRLTADPATSTGTGNTTSQGAQGNTSGH